MSDPLWDEFDQVERTAQIIAATRRQLCPDGDHDWSIFRTVDGTHVFTKCVTCGLLLHRPGPIDAS